MNTILTKDGSMDDMVISVAMEASVYHEFLQYRNRHKIVNEEARRAFDARVARVGSIVEAMANLVLEGAQVCELNAVGTPGPVNKVRVLDGAKMAKAIELAEQIVNSGSLMDIGAEL